MNLLLAGYFGHTTGKALCQFGNKIGSQVGNNLRRHLPNPDAQIIGRTLAVQVAYVAVDFFSPEISLVKTAFKIGAAAALILNNACFGAEIDSPRLHEYNLHTQTIGACAGVLAALTAGTLISSSSALCTGSVAAFALSRGTTLLYSKIFG